MTVVPTATSTSKKEAAQLVTVLTWATIVTQKLVNAFALPIQLEKSVLSAYPTLGATALSLAVRFVTAARWGPCLHSAT